MTLTSITLFLLEYNVVYRWENHRRLGYGGMEVVVVLVHAIRYSFLSLPFNINISISIIIKIKNASVPFSYELPLLAKDLAGESLGY